MNILLLNVNIGKEWSYGGMESHSEIIASALAQRGHTVVMGCWIDGTVTFQATGITLPAVRIRTRNSGDVLALLKMLRTCRREHIDIIIANHGKDFWPSVFAAGLAGIPVVFVRHMGSRLKKTTCWLINRHVDKVIAVSGAVRDTLLDSGVSAEKVEVVHNAVTLERFDPSSVDPDGARRQLGIGAGDIVVGTVGKLHKGKGVFDLLAAFALLSGKHVRLKLLFVGDGPERSALEQEASRLSLSERVIFAGPSKDVARMYAAMDIFVLPSTCSEAFGMVLVEAMAMARPVIATEVGGIPEIVQDNVSGILVPPQDPGSISRAIDRYIEDPALRSRLAEEGRLLVSRRFTEQTMARAFEKALRNVYTGQDI